MARHPEEPGGINVPPESDMPTPKPTAEENFHTSCNCPICRGIRRKAFEEAAEAARIAMKGWKVPNRVVVQNAIRALAKEQDHGTSSD